MVHLLICLLIIRWFCRWCHRRWSRFSRGILELRRYRRTRPPPLRRHPKRPLCLPMQSTLQAVCLLNYWQPSCPLWFQLCVLFNVRMYCLIVSVSVELARAVVSFYCPVIIDSVLLFFPVDACMTFVLCSVWIYVLQSFELLLVLFLFSIFLSETLSSLTKYQMFFCPLHYSTS